ncbi:PREDICTED: uncharacterized protein LOC109128649 [Camelina sativa]|uniref:Uncharacterized protein LOC109128649 n=1 Tax=Camelina sativa TaxID=90675 RepID=A0ABM1QW64_CAMSA|nr:PREDICTED: uncharacterized protein LOC109128649 [Camelina sativa]
MYKVWLLTLSFLLLSGLLNTAEARVLPYESSNPKIGEEGVWDLRMIKEIKAEVGGSCSPRAGGKGPPRSPGSSNIPGSPKRCKPP